MISADQAGMIEMRVTTKHSPKTSHWHRNGLHAGISCQKSFPRDAVRMLLCNSHITTGLKQEMRDVSAGLQRYFLHADTGKATDGFQPLLSSHPTNSALLFVQLLSGLISYYE